VTTPKSTPEEKKAFNLIQWLLEFVNLPFKKGILSVFRPIAKPLNRTPTKEPEPLKDLSAETIKSLKEYYKNAGYSRDGINRAIAEHKSNRGIVDRKGYSWVIENGKPVFAGYGKCYPTTEEFNIFLKKYNFPLIGDVNSSLGFPSCKEFELWNKVFYIFSYLARVNMGIEPGEYEGSQDLAYDLCREYVKSKRYSLISTNEVIFYNSLESTICACIYGFWERHKDLRLKQCPCCGSFWIIKKKRGQPQKYCKECSVRFDDQTREVNNIASKKSKEHKKKADKRKILEAMKRKLGNSAEDVYKKEIDGNINTYKDFVRRKGKYYNLKPRKKTW
jgi:DNA-directed RNA polymerase subunit M/transcription elongation factor TFIIS